MTNYKRFIHSKIYRTCIAYSGSIPGKDANKTADINAITIKLSAAIDGINRSIRKLPPFNVHKFHSNMEHRAVWIAITMMVQSIIYGPMCFAENRNIKLNRACICFPILLRCSCVRLIASCRLRKYNSIHANCGSFFSMVNGKRCILFI